MKIPINKKAFHNINEGKIVHFSNRIKYQSFILCVFIFFAVTVFSVVSGNSDTLMISASGDSIFKESYRIFPGIYYTKNQGIHEIMETINNEVSNTITGNNVSLTYRIPAITNSQVVAFYGKPDCKQMGILGEYSIEQLAVLLGGYARLYDDANGPSGVIPAFHLVYGTCLSDGRIGYLKKEIVCQYIEYAKKLGWFVILDHQIGKGSVSDAADDLMPWLDFPNVHFALDPEWHTQKPAKEIGHIDASDINFFQQRMQEYLIKKNIDGTRMLLVHQFRNGMITKRNEVRTNFDRILVIHVADGFGTPVVKRNSYRANANAMNMPLKGFKLFLKTDTPGAGWDYPLMIPDQVLELDPEPVYIVYQ